MYNNLNTKAITNKNVKQKEFNLDLNNDIDFPELG